MARKVSSGKSDQSMWSFSATSSAFIETFSFPCTALLQEDQPCERFLLVRHGNRPALPRQRERGGVPMERQFADKELQNFSKHDGSLPSKPNSGCMRSLLILQKEYHETSDSDSCFFDEAFDNCFHDRHGNGVAKQIATVFDWDIKTKRFGITEQPQPFPKRDGTYPSPVDNI